MITSVNYLALDNRPDRRAELNVHRTDFPKGRTRYERVSSKPRSFDLSEIAAGIFLASKNFFPGVGFQRVNLAFFCELLASGLADEPCTTAGGGRRKRPELGERGPWAAVFS